MKVTSRGSPSPQPSPLSTEERELGMGTLRDPLLKDFAPTFGEGGDTGEFRGGGEVLLFEIHHLLRATDGPTWMRPRRECAGIAGRDFARLAHPQIPAAAAIVS